MDVEEKEYQLIFSCFSENLVFDFIIVGTGSCGATIAGRLSEICDWNILSIEAGETPPLTAEVKIVLFCKIKKMLRK